MARIDYKKLLSKYKHHVAYMEGIDFTKDWYKNDAMRCEGITEEEWKALQEA